MIIQPPTASEHVRGQEGPHEMLLSDNERKTKVDNRLGLLIKFIREASVLFVSYMAPGQLGQMELNLLQSGHAGSTTAE